MHKFKNDMEHTEYVEISFAYNFLLTLLHFETIISDSEGKDNFTDLLDIISKHKETIHRITLTEGLSNKSLCNYKEEILDIIECGDLEKMIKLLLCKKDDIIFELDKLIEENFNEEEI